MPISFSDGAIPTFKWVQFHMSNGALTDDDGIQGMTRHSSGRYQFNFDVAFSNTNYCVVGMGQYEWSFGPWGSTVSNFGTGSCFLWHGRYGSGTGGEIDGGCLIFTGGPF